MTRRRSGGGVLGGMCGCRGDGGGCGGRRGEAEVGRVGTGGRRTT